MSSSSGSQFTPAQQTAIHADGNVLVSAGAGTGKTRTLVERCLRLISDGVSVRSMLLVTFTEAAASEMKMRLRAALQEAVLREPCGHHAEQLALLESAAMGTLHSFCLQLIRDHFHELALDPQVIVLDESQTLPLMETALDALLDPLLSGQGAAAVSLSQLLRQFSGDPLRQLRGLILQLHRYAQTLPNPTAWYRRQEEAFASPDPVLWRQGLKEGLVGWASEWQPHLSRFRANPNVAACTGALETLTSLDAPFLEIQKAIVALWRADRVLEWPRGSKGQVRDHLLPFFDDVEFLYGLMETAGGSDAAVWESDWGQARSALGTLVFLARGFGDAFTKAKRELGGVDFADLEQLTLRLLVTEEGRPTEVAQHYRAVYSHVFVDEVQDINSAQDAILQAVSRDDAQGNRFLVGDTKQSIYRFRLANPAVFRRYQESWSGSETPGRVIALNDNFRSQEGVLSAVNCLFAGLMKSEVGGVAYDDAARLRFGNPAMRSPLAHNPAAPCLELRVLFTDPALELEQNRGEDGDGDEERAAAELEARWVALRLAQLKAESFPVWDDSQGGFRPATWSDMVVLLRAPGGKAEIYAKEFHKAGVPLIAARGGFFESQEILDILSLLELLDNPLQDVPLLAVLRSPLVGLDVDELCLIRSVDRKERLWPCLLRAAAPPSADASEPVRLAAVQVKVAAFLNAYHGWRTALRLISLSACLEAILAETQYELILQALPRGEARLANVRRLLEMSRQFDPFQRQGLFRFLRFIDAQKAADLDPGDAPGVVRDAVRLMSVHKSKGLEFPLVVAADLGKRWNRGDLVGDILLDEQLGLCPRISDPKTGQRYPSVAHWLARRRAQRDSLGEEIRLLYVAATRARDRLILVGSSKSSKWLGADDEGGAGELEAEGPALWQIARAASALDWIQLFWARESLQARAGDRWNGASPLCAWHLAPAERIPEKSVNAEAGRVGALPIENAETDAGEVDVAALLARVEWTYAHHAASREPAKTTVSVLRRRGEEEGDEAASAGWLGKRFAVKTSGRPSTKAGSPRLSAAERGSLHHAFFQWVDLARTESGLDLRNEGLRMVRDGLIGEDEFAHLDFRRLELFWQSPLGVQIRMDRDHVQRELPFTARLEVGELRTLGVEGLETSLADDERVIVQGQIDLAVVKPEEIWLVDFKTDSVGESDVERRASEYRVQLGVYASALQGIYRRPVTRRCLHFLTPGISVEM